MAGITLEIAEKKLNLWLEAQDMIATGQSYTIGSRTMTRANLTEVRNMIAYWNDWVIKLENGKKHGGRNRINTVVPRDV